ncbi:MAG: carbohydrate kinase family protein [Clostridia bacterium]|nr:carbohydrate kinase family protein [Clostridia bacterium]
MDQQYDILGVGHCCQDTICAIEAYPPEDSSTHILSIDDSQGGGAVGTAIVAASRLGRRTAVIANLGDDSTGDKIIEGFRSERVDTSLIRRIPNGHSPTSIVMVDPEKGTRTKFPYRDSLPLLSFDQAQHQAIRASRVLHLDGTRFENALNAAMIAKEAGVSVSLDGCSRRPDNEKNLRLSQLADILIMNAVYPFAVSGCSDPEQALRFFTQWGPKQALVMTIGAKGSYALIEDRFVHFPAFFVSAIDTTGAGDVFHGAFLTRFLETQDVAVSIRFASAVSALKCLKPGGRSGIPTRQEVDAFLAAHP